MRPLPVPRPPFKFIGRRTFSSLLLTSRRSLLASDICQSPKPLPSILPLKHTGLLLRRFFISPEHSSCVRSASTATSSSSTSPTLIMVDAAEKYRLPVDVRPKHYDLTIKTDLEKLHFEGTVVIELEVLHGTSTLVFNTARLNLKDISVQSDGFSTIFYPSSQTTDPTAQRTTLQFNNTFSAGSNIRLKLSFNAPLTGDLMGYYYSNYKHNGKEGQYAITQFEAVAARRAFPCWDEPLLKATYSITMISRSNTVNISNMPVISERPYNEEGWKITEFQRTPLVSSYLVAFANGPFEYIESSYVSQLSGKTIPLRIYATPDAIKQCQYSLDLKKLALPWFERVFDIEYPLPKLDTLVVHDFDSGAMENWGLITGRTDVLLWDPDKDGLLFQKRTAGTQVHEVAHMWFGNITTMAWWDNLYLNEGFAVLMGEAIIMNKIYPEWKPYTAFITSKLNTAFNLDAKLSSHPIEVECPDADRIDQIFDDLSYSKAASVLRMLSAFVGEDVFLKGVSIYLKKHLFGNTVSNDLWDGISEASGTDITAMMNNWVNKVGFPVLTVTETPSGVHIRQDRFLGTGIASDEHNETLWQVPLNLKQQGAMGEVKHDNTLLLKEREVTLAIDTTLPFKFNSDTTGVYRVLYSPERLVKIATEAAKGENLFTLDDRIGIIHDAFATASAGLSNLSSALDVIKLLHAEKEYLAWQGIKDRLNTIYEIWWEHKDINKMFRAFLRHLFGPLAKQLTMNYNASDSHDIKQLRTLVISSAASAGDQDVIDEIQERFNHFLKTGDDSRIPADLEVIIYRESVQHGGRKQYDAMKNIYLNPPKPSSKLAAVVGLCSVQDPSMINETLNFIMNDAKDQDVFYFFRYFSLNHASRRAMATFMLDNYEEIHKRFAHNTQLNNIVKFAFDLLSSEKDAKDVEEFFKDKDISKFDLSLHQTLDTIRANSKFIHRSTDDLRQWLEQWKAESKL